MPINQFQYNTPYKLNLFNLKRQQQGYSSPESPNDYWENSKTQNITNSQKKKQLTSFLQANYYKDLNDFITQGRKYPSSNRYYREDETPFVFNQYKNKVNTNLANYLNRLFDDNHESKIDTRENAPRIYSNRDYWEHMTKRQNKKIKKSKNKYFN